MSIHTNYALLGPRLRPFVLCLDQFSIWSGKAFAWLIIPMVLALVYEVVARYYFNSPTLWAYDVTYMLYGSHFMLGAAYTLAMQGHIRTDFFYRVWSVRWQGAVDSALYIFLFFPSLALWFYAGFDFAATSWERQEVGITSPWKPIIYPFKTVMPLTTALLMIQGASELAKSLYALWHGVSPFSGSEMDEGDQL